MKTKKRYIQCPKCRQYTRYNKKILILASLLLIFVGKFLRGEKIPVSKRPPCSHCGYDKENFIHVFLETEIDNEGKEIAYYTPEGNRIEI